MTDASGLEERNWIVAQLHAAGHQIDGEQLARWHRAGLIPKPVTKPLGKAKGTQSLYPQGTAAQVNALRQAQVEGTSTYAELGWRLWWDGWDVKPAVVRGYLARIVDGLEHSLSAPPGVIATVTESRYLKGPLKELRDSVGPQSFAALVQTTFAMLMPGFNPDSDALDLRAAEDLVKALQLGYDPALATQHALPTDNDVGLSLGESGSLARELFTKARTALAQDFEGRACEVRDVARHFIATQLVPGSPMAKLLGVGALGEGLLTKSYRDYRGLIEGLLVLLLLTAPFMDTTKDAAYQLEQNAELIEDLTSKKGVDGP